MAFSEYKEIGQAQVEFGIKYKREEFIRIVDVEIFPLFEQELDFNRNKIPAYTSEGARTEAVIFPVLREVYKSYSDRFALWIKKSIRYDDKLNGAPDYLIATQSPLGILVLETPFVAVVEAKKNDFEYGWGQCLAELVAVQKLNNDSTVIYGMVTDGNWWQFGKLENTVFTQNTADYQIGNLSELFGALHFIFQEISKNVPPPIETV